MSQADPLVCGFAVGEDRDAEDESEACGAEFDHVENWLDHCDVAHRGAETVDCRRCGEDTGHGEKHGPKLLFFDESESVIVCFDCQRELLDELRGFPLGEEVRSGGGR